MKFRRALQIVVAVLSALILACLIVSVAVLTLLPESMPDWANTLFGNFSNAVGAIATALNMESLMPVVTALVYGLPSLLLLLGCVLLFLPDKGKQGKYVAGSIMALIGVFILCLFAAWFAQDLVTGLGGEGEAPLGGWHNVVRLVAGVLLAFYLLLVVLITAIKPKQAATATDDTTEQQATESTPEQATAPETEQSREVASEPAKTATVTTESESNPVVADTKQKTAASKSAEEAPAPKKTRERHKETPATKYVPETDVSVHDIVESTYGNQESELNSATMEKIKKVRALYEAKALTQDEYIALVNKYLGF